MKKNQRFAIRAGNFKGVFATRDTGDARPEYNVDAKNVYVQDPANGSGIYGRPMFRHLNSGTAIYAPAGAFRGQAIYPHTNLDGSTINFVVIAGHLFRVSGNLSTFTDVTPVGVTIDAGLTTRVFFASLVGTLTVNDGVNRPWVATNLTSTPITGTYVDYDGHGVNWTMYSNMMVYQGSVVGILKEVNGISRRADISWSAPGDPTLGWQQDTYDRNWTLSQNEAGPVVALAATNLAGIYFREGSIGSFSGQDSESWASTATDDALAFNIGTQTPQCIQKFGDGIFFLDQQGRPYFYQPGTAPDPIWKQMRSFVDAGTANNPTTTAIVATGILEPTLNLYAVAIWSPQPSSQAAPTQIHIFDATTRIYQGHWSVSDDQPVECLGVLLDEAGRSTLVALTAGGFGWALSPLGIAVTDLTTESGIVLTTEDGIDLTTEGGVSTWKDDGAAQEIFALTDRLGFEENTMWHVDMITCITTTGTPLTIEVSTSAQVSTMQGIPAPGASNDETFRTVVGCRSVGRGPQIKIAPASYGEQFVLQNIMMAGWTSPASWRDL